MFKNLEAEMTRQNISRADLSRSLGLQYSTIVRKLLGRTSFTLNEVEHIRDKFFPELTVGYLFLNEGPREIS